MEEVEKLSFSLLSRVWKKINSWNSKCLHHMERETLIKYVVQFIPFYVMSIFLSPSFLSGEIEKMINFFWWGVTGFMLRVFAGCLGAVCICIRMIEV